MIEVAKRAALEAGKEILSLRNKKLKKRKKEKPGDYATEADDSAEKIILDILQKDFPDFNYLSEESGKDDRGSEYTWVIDPLDGTTPFISGMDSFGVSIGLLKGYKPHLGVINLPALDILSWGVEGSGAYINGEEISVSDEEKLGNCVVGFDLAHRGDRKEELEKIVVRFADEVKYPPSLGATVAGLLYTANGVYGAYIHSAYPWDFVAGAAIIKEAGGKISDLKGEEIDWTRDWIDFVGSNSEVHKDLIGLIK